MKTSSVSAISLQSTIENLLRATGRENVDQLLAFMRDHGYYRVRCYKHHMYQGGLAQHSLEVLLRMQRQNEGRLPVDSIIIVSLLHDLCRIEGFSHHRNQGYQSVFLATRGAGFKLRPEESQAILWHMHDPKEKGKLGAAFDAVLDSVLWEELRKADHYSAAHPLSREEIVYAMEGKHRRKTTIDVSRMVMPLNALPSPKVATRLHTEEEKRRQAIKRNNATIEDVFAALREWGIDPEDAFKTVIPTYYEQQRKGKTTLIPKVDNSGFRSNYLKSAGPDEIEMHRTELVDRCSMAHGAAIRVARYIYEETEDVFNCQWPTNEIYMWLKSEFGFPASRENFYKACSKFSNYTNRK